MDYILGSSPGTFYKVWPAIGHHIRITLETLKFRHTTPKPTLLNANVYMDQLDLVLCVSDAFRGKPEVPGS